jgi:hypothetical protein
MIRFTYQRLSIVFLLTATCSFTLLSQPTLGFADKLYHDGDYSESIIEYKRASFLTTNDSLKEFCSMRISLALVKSHQYNDAIVYASRSLQSSQNFKTAFLFTVGLSFYEQHLPNMALPYFRQWSAEEPTSARPWVYLSVAYFNQLNLRDAVACLDTAAQTEVLPQRRLALMDFQRQMLLTEDIPLKSPTLAYSLSIVFPGAGQLYCNHTYDAIQAFLYTGAAALATYGIYRYEQTVTKQYGLTYVGLSITALFHLSNIISAGRTAEYYNALVRKQTSQQMFSKCTSLFPF